MSVQQYFHELQASGNIANKNLSGNTACLLGLLHSQQPLHIWKLWPLHGFNYHQLASQALGH